MAPSRHKHVLSVAKPRRRKLVRVGVPALAVLAVAAPATAAVWPDQAPVQAISMARSQPVRTSASPVPVREEPISRSATRVRLEEKPPEVTGHEFATTKLNVRTEPSDSAPLVDVLDWAQKIAVSGKTQGPWSEVVIDKKSYWVHGEYLADRKPKPKPKPTESATPTTGLSTAACATGSSMEAGLVPNAVAVHRAVCAAFPQVTTYGGIRTGDGGDHGTGHAVDIMIPDSSTGDQIAAFVQDHASELNVNYVIWSQHIWSVQRSSEGWRYMPDRGSATANHYDHVHVSVY